MIFGKKYPVTFSLIEDHPEEAKKIFLKKSPHKGGFIGLAKLEGSFLCDDPGEIFETLEIGEKLVLSPDPSSKLQLPPLLLTRINGVQVGQLPFSHAILPNMLISRGIAVWCHAEAKRFNGGLLEIAVSIYCEKY